MNDNQNDINRLIYELNLQKNKDRKHYLRIEIAKATDRSVKNALQKILDDVEKKERTTRIIGLIFIAVIILVAFYVLGVRSDNKSNQLVTKVSSSSSSAKISETSSEFIEKEILKEKSLSEDEVKQWVEAVWQKRYPNEASMKSVNFYVNVNDKDNLVYINVAPPQTDVVGSFRINANGELEESGKFIQEANYNDWIVISTKFMDTSNISLREIQNKNKTLDTKDLDSEEAIRWVKNYRLQVEGITDEGNNKFKTQLSDERFLEIVVYAWNPTKTSQTNLAVYRINENGYLEKGSPDTFSDWYIVSTEYIY